MHVPLFEPRKQTIRVYSWPNKSIAGGLAIATKFTISGRYNLTTMVRLMEPTAYIVPSPNRNYNISHKILMLSPQTYCKHSLLGNGYVFGQLRFLLKVLDPFLAEVHMAHDTSQKYFPFSCVNPLSIPQQSKSGLQWNGPYFVS